MPAITGQKGKRCSMAANTDQKARLFDLQTTVSELLLELVGTTKIPATAGRFVVSEKFVRDTSQNAPVKIGFIGSNFSKWFFGKVEEPQEETELRYQKLRKSSRDIPIINELGGEEKAETSLTEIYAIMDRQKSGEKGVLLTDGHANIFYARDINGILRAVDVFWDDWRGLWHVRADGVGSPDGWSGGSRVFSRNS